MTDDNDTVPVSEVGIGDDEVESELKDHRETIRTHWNGDVVDVGLNNELLDGVAHLHLTFHEQVDELRPELQNYLIANELALFDPRREDGHMEVRVTTVDILETWSGMEGPLED